MQYGRAAGSFSPSLQESGLCRRASNCLPAENLIGIHRTIPESRSDQKRSFNENWKTLGVYEEITLVICPK